MVLFCDAIMKRKTFGHKQAVCRHFMRLPPRSQWVNLLRIDAKSETVCGSVIIKLFSGVVPGVVTATSVIVLPVAAAGFKRILFL
jgi:hypothetical protein